MKFEIDDKTGMIKTANESGLDEVFGILHPNLLEQILQAVKKTQEKIGRKANYKKSEGSDKYVEIPAIIYDGNNGFLIQDIRFQIDPNDYNPRIRVPSPEEVEKFIKHANIAYKKSTNKQIQEIQDSKNDTCPSKS